MTIKSKKFLYGIIVTLICLIAMLAFDRLVLGGRFSSSQPRIRLLEKDLRKTTQEALNAEKKIRLLEEQLSTLTPLAQQALIKEKQLLLAEDALTEAQRTLLDLSEKIANLRNQFQEKLAALHQKFPEILSFSAGRYRLNTSLVFQNASASLSENGQEMLTSLAAFMNEFIEVAPSEFDWFIRVDGHTNHLPIQNDAYPSNWELGSARALTVVKYLQDKGVPGKYLVPSSFSSYRPITPIELATALEDNRRIEFSISHY